MQYVLGVDEAGRGPLAGPLTFGVISAPADLDLIAVFPKLNDSKQLSEKVREHIYEDLMARAEELGITHHVAFVSAAIIDKGLTAAVQIGVTEGVQKLLPVPTEGKVFLDGSLKAPAEYDQETIIKGDSIIPAIMLASVIAKVMRDRHMVLLAKEYPAYGFEIHKGYGTKSHYAALREHGASLEHRQLFLRKFFENEVPK
jgi:ribonuclease HII